MHDTLAWLASFFPTWGLRCFWVSAIFVVLWIVLHYIPAAAGPARFLLWAAGFTFSLFVLMAIFWAIGH